MDYRGIGEWELCAVGLEFSVTGSRETHVTAAVTQWMLYVAPSRHMQARRLHG